VRSTSIRRAVTTCWDLHYFKAPTSNVVGHFLMKKGSSKILYI
jgi:hypothetical protein